MGKYVEELAHRCREEHCIVHFIRISWWGEERKCTLLKKTPERTVDSSCIEKQISALHPATMLTFQAEEITMT